MGLCAYCQQPLVKCSRVKGPVIEHVEPLTRGGEDVPENTVISCASCNNSKSNMFLLEWVWSGKYDRHLPEALTSAKRAQAIEFNPRALVRLRGALSQRELAQQAGISRATLNRMERGIGNTTLRTGTINRLARALGVDADKLVAFR